MATIRVNSKSVAVGKSGSDTLYGNGKANVIGGAGGNDRLFGRGGADIMDGGSGNDTLKAEAGNDILVGGAGRDTLIGGAGYDFFSFDTKPSSSNIDVIEDFGVKYDSILLTKKIFKVAADSKGYIDSSAFWIGSGAHVSDDRIIYNKGTGALYYDADGTESKAAVQFAKLDANLRLTYKDFGIL